MNSPATIIAGRLPKNRFSDLRVGWTVRVSQKLKEGEKGKNTVFEGMIIAKKHGDEPGASITVRKASGGYGVERVFPLRLPSIEKIEVLKKPRTRRAKLYYLREKSAREIRKKIRAETIAAESLGAAAEAPAETPVE